MIEVEFQARSRSEIGKSAVKRVRRDGLIPAVLYGHGEEAVSIAIKERAFKAAMQSVAGENIILNLELDGKSAGQMIIKEVQIEPVTQSILHVDFQLIHKGEKVVVEVPVIVKGVPAGVKEGGILDQATRKLEVKCLPSQIPDHFEVDVSELSIGDSLHVSDIHFPDGQILTDISAAIASVIAPKAKEEVPVAEEVVAAPAAEAEAAPEEAKGEEEEEES